MTQQNHGSLIFREIYTLFTRQIWWSETNHIMSQTAHDLAGVHTPSTLFNWSLNQHRALRRDFQQVNADMSMSACRNMNGFPRGSPLHIVLLQHTLYRIYPGSIRHHDDVIKWKHFPRHWPFVRGIHPAPVNSPHKASDAELWCSLWSALE